MVGFPRYRKYWSRYYEDNDGILYVLDASASREDIGGSIALLYEVLDEEKLGKCPTMILVNKLDVEGAQPFEEVWGMIDEARLKGRRSLIAGCSTNDR